MDLGLWFLFPLAIGIAMVAMSTGISGSNFWIPVYIIWLGFDPLVGFWLGLVTMLFGFGSGAITNLARGTLNREVLFDALRYAAPAAILGSLLVPFVPTGILIGSFAVFVLLYGTYMIVSTLCHLECVPVSRRVSGRRAFAGGFLKGLIATGLGKLLLPSVMNDERIGSVGEAVGTTVITVFAVNLIAVSFRLTPEFVDVLVGEVGMMVPALAFAIPGVIIGGQLGPRLASRLSRRGLRLYVGAMLIIVSLLMGLRALSIV